MREPAPDAPDLSLVVPVCNEAENITPLLARLRAVLDTSGDAVEIIFVEDSSTDGTVARIEAEAARDPRIRLLRLSRGFGHQVAIFAGLDHARGAAVITLDGDLQHPPELIPELVARWRQGAEVVQAIRREPVDRSPFKRAASRGFYQVLSAVSRVRVTPGAADFRLLARPALDAFLACRERHRFNRGLVQWIGFEYVEVPYDAAPRSAGRTKFSWRAMFRLAGDAIFSFSSWPLRIAGMIGALVSCAAALYLAFALWAYFFTERPPPGWTSTLATVLALGGVQLIVLWILGEYVGRLYDEAKHRPLYIVRSGPASPPSRSPQGPDAA